jgi:hypothetical protein
MNDLIFQLTLILPAERVLLGPTLSLPELNTRNLPGSEGRPACKNDNLADICEPTACNVWEPQCLTIPWASTGIDLTFSVNIM